MIMYDRRLGPVVDYKTGMSVRAALCTCQLFHEGWLWERGAGLLCLALEAAYGHFDTEASGSSSMTISISLLIRGASRFS